MFICPFKQSFCLVYDFKWVFIVSGVAKPTSVEQPELISIVLGFVQQFVPEFTVADIIWVRSMKTSKLGVLNIQCRSVVMASNVRSTFANLVNAKPVPAFIGKVTLILI